MEHIRREEIDYFIVFCEPHENRCQCVSCIEGKVVEDVSNKLVDIVKHGKKISLNVQIVKEVANALDFTSCAVARALY